MLKGFFNKRFELTKTDKILYLVFFIFFLGYLSTLQYRPYPFSYIVKIIPILSLSFISIRNIRGNLGKILFIGLLFSALGDLFLALSGKKYFIAGLSSFGAAHFMYILAFFKNPVLEKPKIYLGLLFIVYGIVIWSLLSPNLGNMLLPVTIYILLITLMGLSSVLGKNNHPVIILGALLFVISDSVIAVNMFLNKVPNSSFWIMLTYYPAQLFITYGACLTNYKKQGNMAKPETV